VALARALAIEPSALLLDEPFSALDTHLRSSLERQLRETLSEYRGTTLFVSHNLEEAYRVCEDLVVLSAGIVAAKGPKEEIFRRPPTLEVARLTGCKNFSRGRETATGIVEALDWGCSLRVNQRLATSPEHVAIRAHHIRLRAPDPAADHENVFPCWPAAITETPFRVTLDLKLNSPPRSAADYHLQAEVFKQEWELYCSLPQPWQVELSPDRLFLLPD
jgi:molybdate transport system permease protein